MSVDDLEKLISRLGFPVFVALYLLWERWSLGRRLERLLIEAVAAMHTLNQTMGGPNGKKIPAFDRQRFPDADRER